MKSATSLIAVCLLLTACRHTETTGQRPPDTKTDQYFAGTPTAEEMATDLEIRRHIIGAWTTAEDPQWATYHVLTIRSDGSFATLWTNCPNWEDTSRAFRTNTVREGTWRLERGFLLLVRSN